MVDGRVYAFIKSSLFDCVPSLFDFFSGFRVAFTNLEIHKQYVSSSILLSN